ncbi:N-acetyltransferase [Psychrobacillus sp. FSL K6-2684]|uniref:GNAT family N-acetyltransferase n=1 Tax=Psychrobacillus faecigallinarum TaxID=2762235 RepID=A0ABR8RA31_9BACI|nr:MULTISPECIES: N-acetyltransferase [Psychrobacillus]MBD7944502.1 GNAT family N-acetyltransferase [Psychrobacillus faecigallinarum]QEY19596.1 N-acetyltransferase [Psychrobacillus sp. AK 1817]QGM30101.1 GNAT family N-acetyltransferase [Bacillus sp. N3536]
MLKIKNPKDIHLLSEFLEKLNLQPEYHIGYCGVIAKEIEDTILHDFSDLDFEHSFVIATEHAIIKGALGFDVDEQLRTIEVWGPFVLASEEYREIADGMWNHLVSQMPFDVKSFQFFVHKENFLTREYIREKGGVEIGQHLILSIIKKNHSFPQNIKIIQYSPSFEDSFTALHTASFSNTYYNSSDILRRLDNKNKLFIFAEGLEKVKGYVYVEIESSQNNGSIEYIAVSSEYQKQGIGTQLIQSALNYLFSYDTIKEITLSVRAENDKALALYKSVGFELKYELIAYRK